MNRHEVFEFLNEANNYILQLKIMGEKSKKLVPIMNSRVKAGFRGYVIDIISVTNMYNEFIETENLMPFLATYRLSQDHLEMYFSKIRSMNGNNDNMTVQQFTSAYKKLLHQCDVRISGSSNISVAGCSSNILTVSSRRAKIYDDLAGEVQVNIENDHDDFLPELYELELLDRNSYLIENGNSAGIAFVANSIENRILTANTAVYTAKMH